MKQLILIGNIGDGKKGPSRIINELYSELQGKYKTKLIDTSTSNKIILFFKLLLIILKRKCNVNVHSFGYKIPYIIYVISKINKSNNYYLTLHGISSLENEIEQKYKKIEKKIINDFPNIICVSNFQKNILASKFNRKEKVFVVENGSDICKDSEFKVKTKNDYCILIMAGGFSKIKNTLETIKIVEFLNKNNFKCILQICGKIVDKDYYDKCINYIKQNNLSKHVEYLGLLDENNLINKYTKSNYCISVSKFDTFNLTILEAMQNSTPVIVMNTNGISDIITKNAGLVLKKLDYNKIYNYLLNNYNSDEIYNESCRNAWLIGQVYNSKRMAEKYYRIFEEESKCR